MHAEADGIPGCVVDRFGDVIVVEPNAAGADRLIEPLVAALDRLLKPRTIVVSGDGPARTLEGLAPVHRVAKGSLDGATVNEVVQLLSETVRSERLPPKVLVVHRFTEHMLTNAGSIRPTPQVQVVITMDGFGAPAAKLSKYDLFIRDERVQFAGLKLFYKQDLPLLTPREVVELDPPPNVVIYQ